MEEKESIVSDEEDNSELSSEGDDDDDGSDEDSAEGTEDNEDGDSDSEDSSSSDNDPQKDLDDEDDDTSSSPNKKQKRKAAEIESDSSSDDDLENGERTPKCPICLNRLSKSLVASPDSGCIHNFCLECLREWSKNNNTCPIDRSEFFFIIIKSNISGEELTREEVVREKQALDPLLIQDVTLCEVCGSGDREESLLLCDGCDLGYHLDCCNPPLQRVPQGLWYCMNCSGAGLVSDYIRLGHRLDLAEDPENGFLSQALPRTMIIERIRRVIRGRQFNGAGAGPSRQIRRKSKTRRKRKTTKKRQSLSSSSLTGKPKQTRRKSKKRKLSKKIQRKKEKREKRRQERKTQRDNREHEGHSLTLFGRANDLDFYGDEELFVCPGTSTSASTSSLVPSTSAGCSNSTVANVEQQMNFLEDILNAQSNFFSETSNCNRTERSRNEIYTRPDLEKEESIQDERRHLVASAGKKHQSGIARQEDQSQNPLSEKSHNLYDSLGSSNGSGSPKSSASTSTQWRPTEIKAANRFHLGTFKIPRRPADQSKSEEEPSEAFQFKVSFSKPGVVEEPSRSSKGPPNREESRKSWKKSHSSDYDARSSRDRGTPERSHHDVKPNQKNPEHQRNDSRPSAPSSSRKHTSSSPPSDTGHNLKDRHESRTSRPRSHKEKEPNDRPDSHSLPDESIKTKKVKDPEKSDRQSEAASKTRHKAKSSTSPRSEKPQDLPGFVIHIVKLALAPHYQSKTIPKDIFKVIVRKASDKVLSREKSISSVQESKVRQLVEAYVDRYKRKGTV